MLSLPSFLALLLPLPALREDAIAARRRHQVSAMHLSRHLLEDAGLAEFQSPADDPRWVRRFDLDR